jgi:CHAT domain
VDDSARERYRARVWRDNLLSRQVEQYRVIEGLLAEAAELDAHITRVVRSLGPAEYRAFLDVLTMMRATEFKAAARDDQDTGYQAWSARTRQDVIDRKVTVPQWAAIDRKASLLGLSDKAFLLRQLDPVCPAAAEQRVTGPSQEILGAAQPLFARYATLQPRIGIGTADESLDYELSAVLAGYRDLREQEAEGSEDWKFLQWWCAATTGSLARSAAIQRRAKTAIREFGRAAAEWRRIGESDQVADCLTRAAEIALADGADVDEALGPLVQEAGPPESDTDQPVSPTISRAQLLVRLAQVYLDAGDNFDAAIRADEAATTLDRLGFADPARVGAGAAFSAWVAVDPAEDMSVLAANRTLAMLSAVTEAWSGIIRVRVGLGLAHSDPAGAAGSGSGTELLYELAELTSDLGEEALQVNQQLAQESAGFGLPPTVSEADQEAFNQARKEALIRQALPLELNVELNRLLDEFAQCENPGLMASLLAKVETLENRVLGSNLPGLASTATTVSVLRSDVLVQLGRLDEAATVLAAAKTRLTGSPDLADAERRSLLVTLIIRQVMVQGRREDFRWMSRLCGEGIREVELDRGKVNAPYLQDSYLRERGHLYDWGVFAAQKIGDDELALARSELAKARGVLGWAALDRSGAPPDQGTDRADEAKFRDLTATLARGDPATSGPDGREQAAAQRRVVWDRLMTARSRSARRLRVPGFGLAALQASLASDEAVVSYYWPTPTMLLITTIDHGSYVSEKVVLKEAQRADLAALVSSVGSIGSSAPWLEDDIPPLGEVLLPQQGGELLTGKRRLIISPHRLLHQLPFHAFSYGQALLVEQFGVTYVPNLTSLLLSAPAPRPRKVLALGVSSFSDPPLRPLKNAAPEAAAIAALYRQAGVPTTELINDQVTATRINDLRGQGALAEFTTLHLGTHGDDVPPDAPFDAALHMPVGTIDGLEISQWRLHADLVVMSACYSARRAISGRRTSGAAGQPGLSRQDEELFGDEVLGLQAAFFAAGACQVLGALWPADDTTTPTLMTAFHQAMIGGEAADLALRQAMLDLRAADASMHRWAPFKLVRLGSVGPSSPAGPPATT